MAQPIGQPRAGDKREGVPDHARLRDSGRAISRAAR